MIRKQMRILVSCEDYLESPLMWPDRFVEFKLKDTDIGSKPKELTASELARDG